MQAPSGIGETFRQAREARRLSLADVERLTKIRGAYLAALEDERFDVLPPYPYSKGFVRAYARLLGLNADRLVAEFEARFPPAPATGLSRAVEIPLEPAVPLPRWRRVLTYALWMILVLALYAGYVGYTQLREFARSVPAGTPAPSPGAGVSTPAPGSVSTPGPAAPGGTPAPAQSPAPPTAGVTVALTTTGKSWVRVIADGEWVFQGILDAGDARTWTAERELTIRIGNAAAVELTVNGQSLGPLGGPGKVVELRFPQPREEP